MSRVMIIAEAGVNHNGDMELAKKLVDVAAEAGVDAVKFQTFNSKKLVSKFADKANYQKNTTDSTESQLTMLQRLELSKENHSMKHRHGGHYGLHGSNRKDARIPPIKPTLQSALSVCAKAL